MARVYYPQLQIKMSISFLTSDFSVAPKPFFGPGAVDSLSSLIRKEPERGDHYLMLSSLYQEYSYLKKADSLKKMSTDLFMKDMMRNPADTHAVRMLANIFLGNGDWQLAQAYYQELTKLAPNSSVGWNGLALISMGNYDMEPAMTNLEKAIAVEPNNLENYCQMANLMMVKAIYDLNAYDSTVVDTLSFSHFVNTSFLEDALKKRPGDPSLEAMLDALHLTGIIYQAFLDNADKLNGHGDSITFKLREKSKKEADLIAKRMEERTKKTFTDRDFPYSCLMLVAFLNNDPETALKWFEKGVRYSGRSQNLYENMTGICALTLRKDCAYHLQLKLDSIHPTVANYLMTAYFYYLDGRFKEAQTWTQEVLLDEPNNLFANLGMAAIKTRLYKFKEAVPYLDKASSLDAKNADVLMLTAVLYIFDNSPLMAKATLNGLAPSYPGVEVDELLDRFFK
jgi:tetratricopeptide (TPR) repeat protein